MPVPSSINDLSTTPGSNFPLGSENPATFDDYMRSHAAFIAQLRDGKSDDSGVVKLAGAQTVTGNKTFSGTTTFSGTATGTASATTSAAGFVELANDAEFLTGTSPTLVPPVAVIRGGLINLGTAVTLTTQTSVDFTSIPSWAKRITVMFNGVSTNGTSPPILQFGDSGGIETTGYLSSAGVVGASTAASSLFTNGIGLINATAATVVMQGAVTLSLMTGTTWVASGVLTRSDSAGANLVGGSKATSAALDRIRLTTSGGADQFDAGSVSISWE